MDAIHLSHDDNNIHMLTDPTGGEGDSSLSFARLSAPLPHLSTKPGRSPCLEPQEVRNL